MGGEFTSNHYTTSPQTRYDEGLSDLFKTVNKRDYPGRQKKKKKPESPEYKEDMAG